MTVSSEIITNFLIHWFKYFDMRICIYSMFKMCGYEGNAYILFTLNRIRTRGHKLEFSNTGQPENPAGMGIKMATNLFAKNQDPCIQQFP